MLQQRPRFRPVACVTHLHTPQPRFLQAWRGLLLPGPIPGVAKVHHRSLSPSQRLSPDPAVAPPTLGPCLSPSPRRSREGGQIPSPLRGEGEDEGETPAPRRREECNQMQLNATDLKVCHSWPLVTRPTRASNEMPAGPMRRSERSAKRGHRGPISSLPARSKRGQTGPNGSRNQPSPVVPVKTGTSHPCVGAPCVDVGAVREPPEVTPPPTYSQTNDNCPLHHAPAGCYIVHIRHSRADGQIPSPLRGEG